MKKLILSGLCLSALLADFTLEYKMGDNTSQLVQYKDGKHVKISTSSASNEDENVSQIIIGDKKDARNVKSIWWIYRRRK